MHLLKLTYISYSLIFLSISFLFDIYLASAIASWTHRVTSIVYKLKRRRRMSIHFSHFIYDCFFFFFLIFFFHATYIRTYVSKDESYRNFLVRILPIFWWYWYWISFFVYVSIRTRLKEEKKKKKGKKDHEEIERLIISQYRRKLVWNRR